MEFPRFKLAEVTEEQRAEVRRLLDQAAHDEQVMAWNKQHILVGLIRKGITKKPTRGLRKLKRRNR